MQKDPSKRMSITETLDHPWIQKFQKTDRKKTVNGRSGSFKLYASTAETINELDK